jgi:hypothetical protein
MLTILAVSVGIGLLFFYVDWLKRSLSATQKPKRKKQQSDTLETALEATLINLPLDIGSEAAVDSVVEEGSQGVIEAVFESVGSLFDGL